MSAHSLSKQVIPFWFSDEVKEKWWIKSADFDAEIREKFLPLYEQMKDGIPSECLVSGEAYLTSIIVLDQFSRNMFRDTPKAFATDSLALELAKEACRKGVDADLSDEQVAFLYMPFMHSENEDDQEDAIRLFASRPYLEEKNLSFAHAHKKIIDRFGRYPHRNEILGRESTQEEIEFLKEPNSSF